MYGYKWYGTAIYDMRAGLGFGHSAVTDEDDGYPIAAKSYNKLAASSGRSAMERLSGDRENKASFKALPPDRYLPTWSRLQYEE